MDLHHHLREERAVAGVFFYVITKFSPLENVCFGAGNFWKCSSASTIAVGYTLSGLLDKLCTATGVVPSPPSPRYIHAFVLSRREFPLLFELHRILPARATLAFGDGTKKTQKPGHGNIEHTIRASNLGATASYVWHILRST